MSNKILYATITNCTGIQSVSVVTNHDSPVTTANFDVINTSLTLGDEVTIDLGYTDSHAQIFTGYVKQVERKVPDNTYSITAYDNLVRAQDYFIASSDPNNPFKRKNISAEQLVTDLLALAGLNTVDAQTTYFTFGVQNEFEVNLVTVYDYIRTICDLLTWTLWADSDGTVHFRNRKPYVMLNIAPENLQPGWVADTPTGFEITVTNDMDAVYTKTERNLRNRIVVYGSEGIHAEATAASAYLPDGFYKSAVLAFPQLIDNQDLAQDIADYNLDLMNRVTETLAVTILGTPTVSARTVIGATVPAISVSGNWYVYGCDHNWSNTGYTTGLNLRRMLKE